MGRGGGGYCIYFVVINVYVIVVEFEFVQGEVGRVFEQGFKVSYVVRFERVVIQVQFYELGFGRDEFFFQRDLGIEGIYVSFIYIRQVSFLCQVFFVFRGYLGQWEFVEIQIILVQNCIMYLGLEILQRVFNLVGAWGLVYVG